MVVTGPGDGAASVMDARRPGGWRRGVRAWQLSVSVCVVDGCRNDISVRAKILCRVPRSEAHNKDAMFAVCPDPEHTTNSIFTVCHKHSTR